MQDCSNFHVNISRNDSPSNNLFRSENGIIPFDQHSALDSSVPYDLEAFTSTPEQHINPGNTQQHQQSIYNWPASAEQKELLTCEQNKEHNSEGEEQLPTKSR